MDGASRRAVLCRTAEVLAGTVDAGNGESPAALCLFSIWRRTAGVYRSSVRADGSTDFAGYDWSEMAPAAFTRSTRGNAGVHNPSSKTRDTGAVGKEVKLAVGCPRLSPWVGREVIF